LGWGRTANHIAKWNGSTWTAMGPGNGLRGEAHVLAVFDDGSGPALYAGQDFNLPGAVWVHDFLKWNGSTWSTVGGGLDGGYALSMTVHDDGSGSALYVGGTFTSAGGQGVRHIARWDGHAWTALGLGVERPGGTYVDVEALKSFDDGSGRALYVGGASRLPEASLRSNIARWDGHSLVAARQRRGRRCPGAGGLRRRNGPALFAGGLFTVAGGASAYRIASGTARAGRAWGWGSTKK
jgi:hypothetical protein